MVISGDGSSSRGSGDRSIGGGGGNGRDGRCDNFLNLSFQPIKRSLKSNNIFV